LKKKFPEENLKFFDKGFESLDFKENSITKKNILNKKFSIFNGNEAISTGSELAGLTHYFAYPMSPATSVVNYFDKKKVFQLICSDEISAVSMCLGAMYAGKNALTATSSGGFDLMTETISASAVMEIPLVVVLSQRPGPGTGLPTWDSQDNINIAVFGGHGDFPRSVLCVSDAESAIRIMPIAFKIAKKHKVPCNSSYSKKYF
jgi:2-oxoglutarate/2-oxoacid ferredoxin oxidoreductase subunit alpha